MRFSTPTPPHDLTYSDVFLVPSHSDVTSRLDVDLAPADGTRATLPIVAANMNSVTGERLAATLARRGGLGVLPQDLAVDEMVAAIDRVKHASPVWDDPFDPKDPRLAGVDIDALPTIDVLDARDAFDALVAGRARVRPCRGRRHDQPQERAARDPVRSRARRARPPPGRRRNSASTATWQARRRRSARRGRRPWSSIPRTVTRTACSARSRR
jgi:hypothetical protein